MTYKKDKLTRISIEMDAVLDRISKRASKKTGHRISKVMVSRDLAKKLESLEFGVVKERKKKKLVGFNFDFKI